MNIIRVGTVIIFAGLMCHCKNTKSADDTGPGAVEVRAIASYGLLEDLESEDSYVGSELGDADIEREIEAKSTELKKQIDKNQDGVLGDDERSQLKNLFKDKMLEKFDVDSDGSFSQVESDTIMEQIRMRLDEFHQRHPENFADKRPVVCKVVSQRGGVRPLWQNILEKCQG